MGRVAVVVITRDRADELLHTLARLTGLPERPEIVVVDQGSRDGTPERVREHFPSRAAGAQPALVRLAAAAAASGAADHAGRGDGPLRDPAARAGLVRAVAGAHWVIKARRPVPEWLEADLRLLEAG